MSAFNFTPISILDKGPMGGFRGGMADNRSIMHSNSDLQTEDLNRAKTSQDMETVELKRPLDAVEQAKKIKEAELLKAEMDSGIWQSDRERKRREEEADLQKKLTDNQMQELNNRLQGVQAAGMIFGDETDPAKMAMGWETAREEGKRYGFDLGEYNKQNVEKFFRMRQNTPIMQRLYENNLKEKQKLEYELIGKGAQHNYDMAKQIQSQGFQAGESKLNRQTQLDVARTYRPEGGSGGDPKSMGAHAAQVFAKANRFMESGNPNDAPTEMELQLLENNMARNEALNLMKADPMLKLDVMTMDEDPASRAKVEAALPKFMAMTGSGRMLQKLREKVQAVRGGGGGRPSAPKGMGGGTGSLFSQGGSVTSPVKTGPTPATSGGFTLRGSRPAGG